MRARCGNGRDGEPILAELTLSDLFEDPLVRLLMASDGAEARSLWKFLMETADRSLAAPR